MGLHTEPTILHLQQALFLSQPHTSWHPCPSPALTCSVPSTPVAGGAPGAPAERARAAISSENAWKARELTSDTRAAFMLCRYESTEWSA
jgi:hypothetical protein